MGAHGHADEELAVQKSLKVYVGGLPHYVEERDVGNHFGKYGHVLGVTVIQPQNSDRSKAPYAFATYKFAADADCAVVDPQHFPGCRQPLKMGFAAPPGKDLKTHGRDPCKVFVGGITDRDSEEQVGDFFSQWGLVILVYRGQGWGMVAFATKEAANRLLEEGTIIFQRRRLDIKPSDSKKHMEEGERHELVTRAIARHFHKKTAAAIPPAGPPGYPPQGGYPPPAYYGQPPHAAAPQGGPHGAPPPGYYGAPPQQGYQGAPQTGYPPSSYPPRGQGPSAPGHQQPPPHYGGHPRDGGHHPRDAGAPRDGGHHPPPQGHYGGPPSGGGPPAAPSSADAYAGPPHGSDPYARPYDRDPYAPLEGGHHQGGAYGAPPHGGSPHDDPHHDYYRDNRGDARDRGGQHEGGYYTDSRPADDGYGRGVPPSSDPRYDSRGPSPSSHGPPAGGSYGHDRYAPY